MVFRHKDGELRIYDASGGTGPYYVQVLFTDANLTFPLGRGKTEEMLVMDRTNFDSNSHYVQGGDEAIMEALPMSVTCKFADTAQASYLRDWLSGVTIINSKTLATTKASSSVTIQGTAVTTPGFADATKMTYDVEILWDGSNDYGFKLMEVYFEPREQTITEGEDGVAISINGLIYGQISGAITAFSSGTSIQQ